METTESKMPLRTIVLVLVLVAAGWAISTNSARESKLAHPMSNFEQRPKLLTFGMHVTPDPANNPIDPPERFSGYHAALDLEIFGDEKDEDVEVYAICDGTVLDARTADGYGGVLVHDCSINGNEATVLYGHIDIGSASKKAGDQVRKGERIAILGDHKSDETGDTRKHLHLGIHKGPDPAYAGYVTTEAELKNYIDPLPLF